MGLRLEIVNHCGNFYWGDFDCPYCWQPLLVSWRGKQGDPYTGEHCEDCPKCGKPIGFSSEVEVTYVLDKIKE